jgi:hypothetical protein
MANDTWQYQGRQEHGWFGSGTAPAADSSGAEAAGGFPPPPYVANDPMSFLGRGQVGNAECVTLVKRATGAPQTSSWQAGESVEVHPWPAGTAVATFDADGRYGNHTDGSSHAAIITGWTPRGFYALEQFNIRDDHGAITLRVAPRVRFYEFGHTGRSPIDNGSNYRVVR